MPDAALADAPDAVHASGVAAPGAALARHPGLRGLRVAFVTGTLGQGGAERQLFYMLRVLAASGAEPRVFCLTRGEHWEARIAALGVPVVHVGGGSARLGRLRRIVRELRAWRPDVVQSSHFYTNLYAVAAARRLGLPEVGALRSDVFTEVAAHPGAIGRFSLRGPRLVAANSRRGLDNALTLGVPRDRLHFLPNVVDTGAFASEADGVAPSADAGAPVRLLLAGRLVPPKRCDRFLRVVAAVAPRAARPLHATLVGDGPERAALEAQAAAAGLTGRGDASLVTFAGARSDMAAAYAAADVLVLTSDWEGTPNVVLEAMASGLPVVSTRVGGVADLVADGVNGYLRAGDDEAGLADAVLALVDDAARRREFGARARAVVERRHGLPRLAAELERLYARALGVHALPVGGAR